MVTTPTTNTANTTDNFSLLPDDTVLDILTRLISDPRDWSRLSCVSSRFSNLIRSICCRSWCCHFIPNLAADLSIVRHVPGGWAALRKLSICCPGLHHAGVLLDEYPNPKCSRRPIWEPHFASAQRGFSREEGSKLLASRFRGDCLYVSQWPGCVHAETRRKYLLFRGVFKDFKDTSVWKAVRDAKKSKIEAKCAFCDGKETWDLHSAFCLRRGLDFHQGEPVVRAFVCENGHVSGAWVEKPMYLIQLDMLHCSDRVKSFNCISIIVGSENFSC
ncbi:phytochrome A-associated F-box protein isoform X2 [Dendrobium catenatum]|uniref:phytochrome A-associated F-box protein isoform X2 n=1 Tax=Dendrobium catenatum TaxID=906689 RepID=UPI0009F481DE|nr:phytochrome A-associated F-box protein isoform X2 [Dendrobium catenatum]